MKKTLKILSLICAVVLIFGTVSVGMTAYAGSGDAIGDYDFEIANVYKDIDWNNVTAYKSATHVHTVRSDADTEIDDMIHYYYDDFGYNALALTDHGTVNYGWDHDQTRVVLYDYQWFVHGTMDELSDSDYKNIITGTRNNRGYGMMEIPMGIEWNGASTKKYHVNGYYVDAGHGDLSILDNQEDAILGAIKGNYNAGGFSHVNHVGEWSGGNDEKEVYSQGWVADFASYFERYCPNKGGRGAANQGTRGVIGMELVNTADSRTHNDRRYVYDEILKILAPQGINVFGFCEDDAHEKSDCDRNAQYFLINNNKDVAISSNEFDSSNNTSGSSCDYQNNNNDPMDKVQNYYRDAMFYGEFYASSKNSKNSYELGNGFNAVGNYPSISNISVDNAKDQISVSFKDATKVRLVADGNIIETAKTSAGSNTVVFDLNRYEEQINSYVRIYLTGAGGITYLQPFLVTKTKTTVPSVQFVSPTIDPETEEYLSLTKDVEIVVKDSNGSVVDTDLTYEDFYYKLPAGEYTYTASRRGFATKTESFTVTVDEIRAGTQKKIPVTLQEAVDTSYGYFYAPETIYLNPNNNKDFDKYADRDNQKDGAIHTTLPSQGNVFFSREGAHNIVISANVIDTKGEGALVQTMTVDGVSGNFMQSNYTAASTDDTVATTITAGSLSRAITNDEHVLIKWTARYKYGEGADERDYEAVTYSYVYKTPTGPTVSLGAGAYVKTRKNIELFAGWSHSTMYVAASIYAAGITKLEHNNTDGVDYGAYRYAPNSGFAFDDYSTDLRMTGDGYQGYIYKSTDSSGGSAKLELKNNDIGYIYVDRSRINNWKDIPYLKIGFDFNDVDETTGENGDSGSYGVARLAFDSTLTQARDATYHEHDVMFNLLFANNKSNYTEITDYNLSDSNVSTKTGSVSDCLESYGSKRLYLADNTTAGSNNSTALVKLLPSASADEVTVPISAYVKGTKEGRRDEIALEIDLCLVNQDKSALRTEYNNTIKDAFQYEWFENDEAWNYYQTVLSEAAIVLGNPGATLDEIENATEALKEAYDNFKLKEGVYVVKFVSRMNSDDLLSQDGMTLTQNGRGDGRIKLISSEPITSYKFTDDLAANAQTIIGYTFDNYYECFAGDGGDEYLIDSGEADFDLEFAEHTNYTWYFYYTPNKCNLSYNTLGADNDSDLDFTDSTTAYFGEPYTVSDEIPEREGYDFGGWYLELADNVFNPGEEINSWNYASSDGEFIAQWTAKNYEISYDANNNNEFLFRVPEAYKKVNYGDSYTIYETVPEKTGYNFKGWNLNGETEYNEETHENELVLRTAGSMFTWEISHDSVFTAQWDVATYTVDFETNTEEFTITDTITVQYGKPYGELPTPTREGYNLEWYADPNFSSGKRVFPSSSVEIDNNHTLFAKWVAIPYEIEYKLDGGSVAIENPATYSVNSGEITLNNPVKTGYKFLGWTLVGSSGEPDDHYILDCSAHTGKLTFEAHWEKLDYTIHYELNDSDSIVKADNGSNPTTYGVDTDTFEIQQPTRKGYTFLGWTGSNGVSQEKTISIPKGSFGNLNYTAHWRLDTYTIHYNYAGGSLPSGSEENPTEYTVLDEFTLTNPELTGYKFSAWDSTADVLDGLNVTISPNTVTGNLEFTAVWADPSSLTINYELNGGRVEGFNPADYMSGRDTYVLVNPIREGYEFDGWSKNDGEQGAPDSNKVLLTDNTDLTFTAHWRIVEYEIKYFGGGTIVADGSNPTKYKTEDVAFTLINPVRPGYEFAGWTGTELSRATTTVTVPTGSYGNRTYTATWKENNYTITYDLDGGTDAGFKKSYTTTTNYVIGAPVRPGYTFTGWSIDYEGFTWTAGTKINDSHKFVSQSGAYTSDPVSLQSGLTYTINAGTATGLKMYVFSSDCSTFIGVYSTSYKPEQNCVAFLSTDSGTPTSLKAVKIAITGSSETPASYSIVTGSAGNMGFKANWSNVEYTIEYEGIDGATFSGTNPSTYTCSTDDFTLYNPSKSGYVFTGWLYNGSVSKKVTIPKGSVGDRTYTARWEIQNYAINYTGIEGATFEGTNPTTYNCESNDITLINPSKTGCTFKGWTGTGIDVESTNVVIPKGSTGKRDFAANWNVEKYTITYYGIEGATINGTNPKNYICENDDITLINPTKNGANFVGWSETGTINDALASVTIPKGSTGNKVYYAVWSNIEYNINYNLDGGTNNPDNPATYNISDSEITLKDPEKTGYTFLGWTGMGVSQNTKLLTFKPAETYGERTYTAHWQAKDYNIRYYLNNGNIPDGKTNPETYNINSSAITLNNPERTGYTFLGWEGTGIESRTTKVIIPEESTGDRSYTAFWDVIYYTITYSGLEGVVNNNPTTYTVNDNFQLNNPVKLGYTFDGWSGTGITGSGISTSVSIKNKTGNRNYTANFTLEKYTITYDLDGGSEGLANPTEYYYNSASFTLNDPIKTGFEFKGWTSDYFEGIQRTVTVANHSTGSKIFTAVWGQDTYTITLDPNGGVLAGQSTTKEYTVNTPSFTLPKPTRDGYKFVGWTGDDLGSSAVIDLEIPQGSSGNRTYRAKWVVNNSNSITYNLNGGEITKGSNAESFETDSGTLSIISPTKEGYKFAGWTVKRTINDVESDVSNDTDIIVKSSNNSIKINVEYGGAYALTASWTPLSYRISYNLNGGTATGSNKTTYTIEDSFTISNPTRTGYTFAGWSGTALTGTNNTSVSVLNKTGNRTYTANWTETTYTITYDLNGGSVDTPNPTSYTVLTPSFTLNNPARTGYEFKGWTGSNGSVAQSVVTVSTGSTGNKEYYAVFSANEYTITYNLNGGTVDGDNPETYTPDLYDDLDEIVLINPERGGYTFTGWTSTTDGVTTDSDYRTATTEAKISKGSSGNRAFTAHWTPNTYTITYELDGGIVKGVNPETYTPDSAKIVLVNPEKSGFSFSGWTSTTDGEVTESDYSTATPTAIISKGSYGDKVFTAVWGEPDYSIAYHGLDVNDIEDPNRPKTYKSSVGATIADPAKAGYEFEGWIGSGLSEATKNLVLPVGTSGNKSFTATWTPVEYSIEVNLNGGSVSTPIPESYTIESGSITLPIPKKDGFTFLGWSGTGIDGKSTSVVIPKGTTGGRTYTAEWKEITGDTHKIIFYGYANRRLIFKEGNEYRDYYKEVTVGEPLENNPIDEIDVTAGYKIVGWDIDYNADKYKNSKNDIEVHAILDYGPDEYDITVNGTEVVTKTCTQYELFTASTALYNNGEQFSYWISAETGEIASYYRNYSFYADSDVSLIAVYGKDQGLRATTRISKIEEYDENYDWITVYAERDVGTELTVLQHGIIFTDDASIASDPNAFELGKGCYTGVASTKTLTGTWTLSIPNPAHYGPVIYTRSFVVVVDAKGVKHTIYSEYIRTYNNTEDPTP